MFIKIFFKIFLILLILKIYVSATDAAESSDNFDVVKLSIGGGYAVSTNIRKDNDLDGKGGEYVSSWIPLVSLSWWRLSFRGMQLQFKLFNDSLFSASLKLSRMGQEYRSGYLSKRRSSFAMGGEIRIILINISYLRDIDGVSGGSIYQFSSGIPLPAIENLLFIHLGFGLELNDRKYVDYYFGVRDNEITSYRPQYSGEKTWNRFIALNFNLKPVEVFSTSLSIRYKSYGPSIKNSPTVRTNNEFSYAAMMVFNLL
ncbi:MAG: MipA/OmpV family protein [Oligoflexia bacterium]|nr:MipA/OmpV family protein [Oligoflexia bacterium]